jgi:drug/metabolite transporter (DMT)-like permease
VAVGFAAIFVRLANEAPPLTTAAYRMLIGAAVLMAYSSFQLARGHDHLPRRGQWLLTIGVGVLLAGHFWSWFASLDRTSVGSSVVIVAMQPLLAGMLGAIFLGEPPKRHELAGIALAAGGLAVISGRDLLAGGRAELTGDGLALLGAFLASGYLVGGRKLRADMSTSMCSSISYTTAAAVLWLLCAVLRPQLGGFHADTWTFVVLLALVPQVVGHTSLNWSLGHYRAITVSLAIIGEPMIATLVAIPVLGEWPTAGVLIGGPLILAGIAVGLGAFPGARVHKPVVVAVEP